MDTAGKTKHVKTIKLMLVSQLIVHDIVASSWHGSLSHFVKVTKAFEQQWKKVQRNKKILQYIFSCNKLKKNNLPMEQDAFFLKLCIH